MADTGRDKWNKYKAAQACLRQKKIHKKDEKCKLLNRNELTVQRMSAEVAGKAQKYARIGPRTFVPIEDEEMSIESIKTACAKYFLPSLGEGLVCDVLAGEQGPSCSTLQQIPDMKLIHVRFISARVVAPEREDGPSTSFVNAAKKRKCASVTIASPKKRKDCNPRSLSVSTMLKLGKVIGNKTTLINLYAFDFELFSWSSVPLPVEFNISKDILGEGGFRRAYKAESTTKGFEGITWVVKEYKPVAFQAMEDTQQSVETHTKKVIQMHKLAQNFARKLQAQLQSDGLQSDFGDVLRYGNIYLGKRGGEFVTIEEYVAGKFEKYINNDGNICVHGNMVIGNKAECLAHYSYEQSNHELMLVDIQGCDHNLFDPEIASTKLQDENEILFTTGNLSSMAIETFMLQHNCNKFCRLLNLKKD